MNIIRVVDIFNIIHNRIINFFFIIFIILFSLLIFFVFKIRFFFRFNDIDNKIDRIIFIISICSKSIIMIRFVFLFQNKFDICIFRCKISILRMILIARIKFDIHFCSFISMNVLFLFKHFF